MYQRMNCRKIVIFCLIWCFVDFSKCAAFKYESQYGNSDTNCRSQVTTCTIETQIEKPPIKNVDVEPNSNKPQPRLQVTSPMILNRQKRSDRGDTDVWKQEKVSKGRFQQRQGHERLSCLLVEEMTSKSEKSSLASGAARASRKRSRKQGQHLRASSNPTSPSNPSSIPSASGASSKASTQQSESQNDPSDDILTSDELLRTSVSETSTLPDRNLLPQSRGRLLGELFGNNAEESSNQKENDEKNVPNKSNAGEILSQGLGTFSTRTEMEQQNQNTPAVPSTDSTDSLGNLNRELRTFVATRVMGEKTEQTENVRTSIESGIQSQDLQTFSVTRGIGQRNEPNRNKNTPAVPTTDSIGMRNRELKTFGATRGNDQRSNPNGNQNIRTFSDTRGQGQRNEPARASVVSGVPGQNFETFRGPTSQRKKNCNHPNLEFLNKLNGKNNQPITFLPLDHQHMSENDREILKTLNDDSVKYSELSETHTDISHLLNSNCDSIMIGPSNDDLFVAEHEFEDIAADFEEQDTANVDDDNAPINLLFMK